MSKGYKQMTKIPSYLQKDTKERKKDPEDEKEKRGEIADFSRRLYRQKVCLKLMDGCFIIGTMVGYSMYEFLIKLDTGDEVIVFKHAVREIRRAPDG